MTDDAIIMGMVAEILREEDIVAGCKKALSVARPIIAAPLRAENEKLRAALNGILDDTRRTTRPPQMNVRMISVSALEAAAAALKETVDE